MKKVRTKHSNKRTALIWSAAILLALVVIVVLSVMHGKNGIATLVQDVFNIPSKTATTDDLNDSDPTTGTKDDSKTVEGVDNDKSTDEVPYSDNASLKIDTLSQSAGVVTVATTITNPSSKGVCTFTFTKQDAKPVTRSVETTTKECATTISEQEFEMVGLWKLQVRYFGDSTQVLAEQDITIT